MKAIYKNLLLGTALLVSTSAITRPALAGRCNPNGICTACSNCKYCAHCSGGGGTCSVCAGNNFTAPAKTNNYRAPSTSTRTTTRSYTVDPRQVSNYIRQQQQEDAVRGTRQAETTRRNQATLTQWYNWTGKCIAVSDGDTIRVIDDNNVVRIRLYGIDAPEKAQAFGQQSKNYLSQAVFGKTVTVYPKGVDTYGRVLAWIFVNGRCVNRDSVANGMSWHYAQYAPKEAKLAALQTSAKHKRTGLWSMNATAPWIWRRAH